jgi:signal recognition particle receptor subunit beta
MPPLGRTELFKGDVAELSTYIKTTLPKHETIKLYDYFKADVYGVYAPGEDKFRFYYECLGNGVYTIFTVNE